MGIDIKREYKVLERKLVDHCCIPIAYLKNLVWQDGGVSPTRFDKWLGVVVESKRYVVRAGKIHLPQCPELATTCPRCEQHGRLHTRLRYVRGYYYKTEYFRHYKPVGRSRWCYVRQLEKIDSAMVRKIRQSTIQHWGELEPETHTHIRAGPEKS